MRTTTRILIVLIALSLGLPALAGLKFQRLDDDQFLVTHRKATRWGGQGKALRTLYEEIASVCVAADFEYFEIRQQALKGRTLGFGGGAGATAEVKFHRAEAREDLIRCMPLADPKKVRKARKKLGG
ncbi:hypothetical protein ABI59_18235 [Acidobacteria bacterium Mor1]|nr:hypothetical protein ABI59_18235 [Acidobacteria bacterium Mor1]